MAIYSTGFVRFVFKDLEKFSQGRRGCNCHWMFQQTTKRKISDSPHLDYFQNLVILALRASCLSKNYHFFKCWVFCWCKVAQPIFNILQSKFRINWCELFRKPYDNEPYRQGPTQVRTKGKSWHSISPDLKHFVYESMGSETEWFLDQNYWIDSLRKLVSQF